MDTENKEAPAVPKIKIKKAKILDELFLEVEYSEEKNGKDRKNITETVEIPVHKDLRDQFAKLAGHLAMICDDVPAKKLEPVIDIYKANGFSLKGEDSSRGVTVLGGKKAKYGYVNLNTPFQRFETSGYPGINELDLVIEGCLFEVSEYLFNNKRAPEVQGDLFAGSGMDGKLAEDAHPDVEVSIPPKKTGSKKKASDDAGADEPTSEKPKDKKQTKKAGVKKIKHTDDEF